MTMSNVHVAYLLDLPLADVEALGDELGIADDEWEGPDLEDAVELLDQADDDNDDED